jgi:hypothetical protein
MKELIQRLRDEARRVRQMAEGGGEQAALYMTCRDHGAACDAYIASHAAGHASNAASFAGLVADMEQAADALEGAARAAKMLRIAANYVRDNDPDSNVYYDDADCDGHCLADDCETAAESLEATHDPR